MKHAVAMDEVALFLPEEIITNTLKFLPVKSLIKFQCVCVCEHWKNLIKIPSFIAEHLHQSTQLGPRLLLHRYHIVNRLQLYFLDCKMQIVNVQNLPVVDGEVGIVSSSNGLLCLRIRPNEYPSSPPLSYLLWNPAFRDVRHVPITFPCQTNARPKGCGFGFSTAVNDYKIVTLYTSMEDEAQIHSVVYPLAIGLWKRVEVGILRGIFLMGWMGFTMNGSIFWRECKQDCLGYVMISFEIATEEFALIPMPSVGPTYGGVHFNEFDHKLAVLVVLYSPPIRNYESCLIELWVLEEGTGGSDKSCSWAKKYSSSPYSCLLMPHTIWRDKVVCESYRCRYLDAMGPELVGTVMSNFTNTELNLFSDHAHIIYNYVESLVPVSNIRLNV